MCLVCPIRNCPKTAKNAIKIETFRYSNAFQGTTSLSNSTRVLRDLVLNSLSLKNYLFYALHRTDESRKFPEKFLN